ncbi:plasma-membrane choline transporter-domain-containing protein [Protomyces lactucae-debilis]|uniref:Protein PNS1 n=1 Tax=Protomyces lactucae-debilis TaxID=2754530 RepID=A0A1Y2F6R9_PROLT|nr:plasma-membrane choline transporter-domain-containing protein [Protomyces lactucae-debilis]ORY78625.1 plasma-membrane choline transporter-domain-containing protein [Protomyces lactucae-debilis]
MQAHAMRWSSLLTAGFAGLWLYTVYSRRSAIGRAIGIIKLAFSILEQNMYLLVISFSTLYLFLAFTFIWILQFERLFLRGTMTGISGHRMWILQGDSWPLGAYFIMVYLWTFGVVSGIQRASISAVTSQWYFHRHDQPRTPPKAATEAALWHALSASFGTICASSLFSLLTRLPLLVVPRRIAGTITLAAYMFLSAPLVNLTSPLTLTYAAIFSVNLKTAARIMDAQPRLKPGKHWQPYRTAKMVLSAARATTALGLGLAAWIQAARRSGTNSSLYGYLVGMIAGTIGWTIVGCVEGLVSVLVDACFVSWIVDADNTAAGRTHCQEANTVFGALPASARGLGALQV